ncbi:MAG: YqgE/AlgH family protein [Woeseiaceae bacterium]
MATEFSSLANQLLIAMPGMEDPNFSSTVTLICEHNDDGALGIVINRPLQLQLGDVFKQLALSETSTTADDPVLHGGPLGTDRGFVLHGPGSAFESSLEVSGDIHLTFSRDVLDAMATGDGPGQSLVALGYASWGAGQLEDEMMANSWLSVPASAEIVFDMPFEQRWTAAAKTLGIDITQIAPGAGHA